MTCLEESGMSKAFDMALFCPSESSLELSSWANAKLVIDTPSYSSSVRVFAPGVFKEESLRTALGSSNALWFYRLRELAYKIRLSARGNLNCNFRLGSRAVWFLFSSILSVDEFIETRPVRFSLAFLKTLEWSEPKRHSISRSNLWEVNFDAFWRLWHLGGPLQQ